MYVKVIYYKPEAQGYAGREYTYFTNLALNVGDRVTAPTATEPNQKAMVTEIDVSEDEISPDWKDRIKEITKGVTE